ncbi:hypothetical protein MBLNU459_g7192t1 [Dothideomycetes sp. NU459]
MNGHSEEETPSIPAAPEHPVWSPSTLAVHADDALNHSTDVAPAMHVSTTFRYSSNPDELVPTNDDDLPTRNPDLPAPADTHIYSRLSAPNTSRLEAILSKLLRAPSLTYASGLAAFHALLVHLGPRVVAIGAGYHGCHGVLAIYQRLTRCRVVDLHDERTWSGTDDDGAPWTLGPGDVVHLETPLNPTGEASDIAAFAARAHAHGALLTVDATFAPPPLQDPFALGADYVFHSGTKYFGGHSDMLCGVVSVGRARPGWEQSYWGLWQDRLFLGATMGSLEGWLGVRSLRTLELRVLRQSASATDVVGWLHGLMTRRLGSEQDQAIVAKTVHKLQHASLQEADMGWLRKQMPGGFGPVFTIWMDSRELAKRLPSKLALFHHATSLGGVESLIEWRRMSDDKVDDRVLRVSIGVENVEDIKADLMAAFRALAEEV